jgi:hypothetical protein
VGVRWCWHGVGISKNVCGCVYGKRIDLAGGMRAVVTNVVGTCSMDVLLIVRDVKKRRKAEEGKEDNESCGGRCLSSEMSWS